MAAISSKKILTPVFRLSYPSLWKATAFEEGTPQFSGVMLFDAKAQQTPEFKEMIEIAGEVKVKLFGADYPAAASLRNPFRNGEEKVLEKANPDGSRAYRDGYGPGIVFVRISSGEEYPPTVYDPSKTEILAPQDRKAVYAGCYCVAVVQAIAYDVKVNKGIKFGFSCLQKVADGQSFGGGGTGAELLPDTVALPDGATVAAAPATGANGEIDF